MILGITGTPACGKSTFAKRLSKLLSIEYIDITDFVKKHNISEKFDEEMKSLVVDTELLNEALVEHLDKSKDYIIDGHFSHDLDIIKGCIVCNCELKELNGRLKSREYSEQKVRENLDAEIFDICYTECLENEKPAIKINCTNELSDSQIKHVYNQLTDIMKAQYMLK